jgi:putative FmdB family regulatory protein
MPIYEFYCKQCHTVFNFFSGTVNTEKIPDCPRCRTSTLERKMSMFACTGKAEKNNAGMDDLPLDESKMEKAMHMLEKEAGQINEDDPRQAANLMRRLSDMTGIRLGDGINEALDRLERGDDPDSIEAEMGDILENEDPFILPETKGKPLKNRPLTPHVDETLYDL